MGRSNTPAGNTRTAAENLLRQIGIGQTFYVDSVSGNTAYSGTRPNEAKATIAQAYALCTAGVGDTIVCLPGHAESVSAAGGVTLAKTGVSLVGLGNGTLRPTLTFDTATTATLLASAVGVKVSGLRLVSNISALACFVDATAGDFLIEDCEFITSSGKEALCFIKPATTKDEFTIRRCKFFQPTDPAGSDGGAGTGCIYVVDTEGLYVEDCEFYGCFETAIIHNKTTAAKRVWVRRCFGYQNLAGAEVFTQVSSMEGGVQHSMFIIPGCDDVTEAKSWGTMSDKFFIDVNSCIGNDGAGGQLAVAGATAAS